MLCTLTSDQGRNVLTLLLVMHLVAEVLILPPRWGERNNWQPLSSLGGVFGARLAKCCGWWVPWSLLHPEGSRRKSSMPGFRARKKLVLLPAANTGFQPVGVRLVPAQDPERVFLQTHGCWEGRCPFPAHLGAWGAGWPAVLGRDFSGLLRSQLHVSSC